MAVPLRDLEDSLCKAPGRHPEICRISRRPNVERLDDSQYRDDAYEQTVRTARRRPMSLVDMVMRLMLEDVNVSVNGLLTFTQKDFHDVCRKRDLEML